jgi:SulP family sulfate permease
VRTRSWRVGDCSTIVPRDAVERRRHRARTRKETAAIREQAPITRTSRERPAGSPTTLERLLPIARDVRGYDRGWLTPDLIAGLTVWALLVPEAIAYASIAGMPPETGLYAALPAVVLYALFATSRQLFVGPSSAVALLSATTVAAVVGSGTADFVAVTSALALLVGVLFVLAGIARLGFVSEFLSKPILDGFVAGLAFVIIIGQAPKLFGVEGGTGDFWAKLWHLLTELGSTNGTTLAVGSASLAALFSLERLAPRVPAALTVVVLSILAVSAFDLKQDGVAVVGSIPTGLPAIAVPRVELHALDGLISGAIAIVLVGFAESIAAARKYASKHGYAIDANKELIALGAANAGAGLFQGFTVDGSLSRTAAADQAGQRTQVANLFNAVLILTTILFFAGLFENLPEATLAAVVVNAVWHLAVAPEKWRTLWRLSRTEFTLALVCGLGVMTIEVLPGLVFAVFLSLAVLVFRAAYPRTAVLGLPRDAELADVRLRDVHEHPGDRTTPGLIVYRFDAELFFANATTFTAEIEDLVRRSEPRATMVLVDAEAITGIDLTAAAAVAELHAWLSERGVTLAVSRVRTPLRDTLARTGLLERIGEENLYPTTSEGVRAFRRAGPSPVPD